MHQCLTERTLTILINDKIYISVLNKIYKFMIIRKNNSMLLNN